mgnify:CR=1 FL=1
MTYRGADQNCLFVPPEVDPTGVGNDTSALREPELVYKLPASVAFLPVALLIVMQQFDCSC